MEMNTVVLLVALLLTCHGLSSLRNVKISCLYVASVNSKEQPPASDLRSESGFTRTSLINFAPQMDHRIMYTKVVQAIVMPGPKLCVQFDKRFL